MQTRTPEQIAEHIGRCLVAHFGLSALAYDGGLRLVFGTREVGRVRSYADVEEWLESVDCIVPNGTVTVSEMVH